MTSPTRGPLHAVLDAVQAGCAGREQMSRVTGLPRDVVDAAVDHLLASGRLTATPLSGGCLATSCGSCVFGSGGRPGCATRPPVASAAVLMSLAVANVT